MFKKLFSWRKKRAPRRVAYLELSTICNAHCRFCTYDLLKESGRKGIVMGEDVFQASLDTAIALGYGKVSFTPTAGELLAHSKWAEFVSTALRKSEISSVYFYTNAILLNEANIDKILNLPHFEKLDSIHISVGGTDVAMYRHMYGVDKFEEVVQNINNLCAALSKSNSNLKIACEIRATKNANINLDQAAKLFNSVSYAHFSIGSLKSYDSLDGLFAEDDFEYLPVVPKKGVCHRLEDIRFAPDGFVWACGCVVSERPNDFSLRLGKLEEGAVRLEELRLELLGRWNAGDIPTACRPCGLYKEVK